MASHVVGPGAFSRGGVSGRYERLDYGRGSGGTIDRVVVETLRLDIDGWYRQKMASGSFSISSRSGGFVEWAAHIEETSHGIWEGLIGWVWGDKSLLRQTKVKIQPPRGGILGVTPGELIVTFFENAPSVTRHLQFASPYFRSSEIEWDTVEGATRVTYINTEDHPNKPDSLTPGPLTMAEVFSRAGVELRRSKEESVVPLALSDADEEGTAATLDQKWSDFELNEVMKTYWSRYKTQAQWASWLLFAGLHEDPDVRGIMFDHEGVYKRQGCAAFNDWWLTQVPDDYDQRDAHIRRRRFVTACHETGHCFNLIHSWEAGAPGWWTLGSEPLASSFMNKPEDAPDVEIFFRHFEYRFSNQELQFIRHVPENFVEMGGPRYGDDPRDALRSGSLGWSLEATVRRRDRVFDFLEPVMVDLTLTNRTDRPQVIDEGIFRDGHNLTISISHAGSPYTVLHPYAIHCLGPRWRVLHPGESISHSVFASAGVKGWHISEPGPYAVHVQVNGGTVHAFSDPVRLRVATPCGRDEEAIAQEFFTDEVGRALVLGGAAAGTQAHTLLEQIADRFGERPVARHAQLSLGIPKMRARKNLRLAVGEAPICSAGADGGRIAMTRGQPEVARQYLEGALRAGNGADTFGTEYVTRIIGHVSDWLEREGDSTAAKKIRAGIKDGA